MQTLITAGGCGHRVLESVVHLCAMGLGPGVLRVVALDTDTMNGSLARVRGLVSKYCRVRRHILAGGPAELPYFRTALDLVGSEGDASELVPWTPVPPGRTLSDMVNHELLAGTETPPDIVDLFFSRDARTRPLDEGLRGNAAAGAATMSLLTLYGDRTPWRQLSEKIRTDLAHPGGSRVFIAGSVFGGTGAPAFHPVAKFLRSRSGSHPERLAIGVAALVPYFRPDADATTDVEAMTEAASSFQYAAQEAATWFQHLREHDDWPFDAVYWVGDRTPAGVPHATGGRGQVCPAHVVELLAAMACLDFLEAPPRDQACRFAAPDQTYASHLEDRNPIRWADLPLGEERREAISRAALEFLLVSLVHAGFAKPLFAGGDIDLRPSCVPWYFERFARRGDWLTGPRNREALRDFTGYCETFHLPWLLQVLGDNPHDPVELFNRSPLKSAQLKSAHGGTWEAALAHLADLRRPARAKRHDGSDDMDRFVSDILQGSDLAARARGPAADARGLAAYLSLLGDAARRFAGREYPPHEPLTETSHA